MTKHREAVMFAAGGGIYSDWLNSRLTSLGILLNYLLTPREVGTESGGRARRVL